MVWFIWFGHAHGVLRAAPPVSAHPDREPRCSTCSVSRWSFLSPSQPPARWSRHSKDSKGRNRFRPPISLPCPQTQSYHVPQTSPSDCVAIYLSTGAFPAPPSFPFQPWLVGPVNSRAKDASSSTPQCVKLVLDSQNIIFSTPSSPMNGPPHWTQRSMNLSPRKACRRPNRICILTTPSQRVSSPISAQHLNAPVFVPKAPPFPSPAPFALPQQPDLVSQYDLDLHTAAFQMENLGIEHLVHFFPLSRLILFLTRPFTGPRPRTLFTPLLRPKYSCLSSPTSKLPPLQPNSRPNPRTETTSPRFLHAGSHSRRTSISSG